MSVDLYTYNDDVRRKVVGHPGQLVARGLRRGPPADAHLAVPGRRPAARRRGPPPAAADRDPAPGQGALLPGSAEPARSGIYEWDDRQKAELEPLRPAPANFIRRMKEELRDLDGQPALPRARP